VWRLLTQDLSEGVIFNPKSKGQARVSQEKDVERRQPCKPKSRGWKKMVSLRNRVKTSVA
jgi:hypothetical protein